MRGDHKTLEYFKTQKPVDYIDTSLTIDTFETVKADLSDGAPAKLWYIIIEQTDNGATNEDLELAVTINGTVYSWTLTAVDGTPYFCTIAMGLTTSDFTPATSTDSKTVGNDVSDFEAIPFVAETVGLVRVKQTTDVDGVAAQIEVNIVWEKLV